MNGRFSPHKSFSQVKTKIILFFKISYFRPYVYPFCHRFLTKKVNSAPFFIILPVQKRFSRGIIPKKNMNGRTPVFGHHYPIMARFRHFTHPTTAGSLHFETRPGGTIPTGRATRQETETGNGQDIVNTAKATLPDIRAPARPAEARGQASHADTKKPRRPGTGPPEPKRADLLHTPTQKSLDVRSVRVALQTDTKIAPTSGACGGIRQTQESPTNGACGTSPNRHEKVPTDRAHASLPTRKNPDGKPSGLSFRKRSAYSSLR